MGFTRLLVNIPLASVGDLLGRRPLLIFGPIANSFAMIGTGLSSTLGELLSWRMVLGVSSSAQMTGGQLYLSDISTPQNRARTLAPMSAAWSAGVAVGPVLGGFIASNYGLTTPFFFVGASVLSVSLINYTMLQETRPHDLPKLDRSQGLLKIRSHITEALHQWNSLLHDKDIQSVVLLNTTFWFSYSGAQLTLLPLLAIQFGLSPSTLASLYTLSAVINVIGFQPAAYLTEKVGRKWTTIPGTCIVVVSLTCLAMASTPTHLVVVIVLWGIGGTILGIAPLAYLTDKTTARTRSQALALLRSGGDLGLLLGAGLSGFLTTWLNIGFAVEVNAVMLAGACVFFAFRATEPVREK